MPRHDESLVGLVHRRLDSPPRLVQGVRFRKATVGHGFADPMRHCGISRAALWDDGKFKGEPINVGHNLSIVLGQSGFRKGGHVGDLVDFRPGHCRHCITTGRYRFQRNFCVRSMTILERLNLVWAGLIEMFGVIEFLKFIVFG